MLLAGMNGNDTIMASSFPATVSVVAIGGEGSDSINGGDESEDILVDGPDDGQDVLNALGGDDALTHNGGADELLGGEGNDLFLSNSVCDGERIVGGPGRDNASWARFKESGAYANLESGLAGRPSERRHAGLRRRTDRLAAGSRGPGGVRNRRRLLSATPARTSCSAAAAPTSTSPAPAKTRSSPTRATPT